MFSMKKENTLRKTRTSDSGANKTVTKAPRAAKATRPASATVTSAMKTPTATGQGCVQPSLAAATEEAIASRAYEIWLQKGCPPGCEEENWRQAESELNGASRHQNVAA
jgi:hypothetical protein